MLNDFQNISLLIKPLADLDSHKTPAQQNKKPMSSLSLNEGANSYLFLHSLCLSLSFHLPSGVEVVKPWGSWSSGCEY